MLERNSNGMKVIGSVSESEWLNFGRTLQKDHISVQFAIGDWANYGEARFDKNPKELAAMFGYTARTISFYQSVAKAVAVERRRVKPGVSFLHHRLVSPFSPSQQNRLLDMVERNNWTTEDLREYITGKLDEEPTIRLTAYCPKRKFDTIVEFLANNGIRWKVSHRPREMAGR